MSNENHNNTVNWRSKLEELENLPGETCRIKMQRGKNFMSAWGKKAEAKKQSVLGCGSLSYYLH